MPGGGAHDQMDSGTDLSSGPDWLLRPKDFFTLGEWVEPQSWEHPANLRRWPLEAVAFHPSGVLESQAGALGLPRCVPASH